MKIPIVDIQKKKSGERQLPEQFSEPFRPDLIRRAVHALQSASRQPYGAAPGAGQRSSSKLSKRRKKYRGCYGFGISRVNRKILSRRGTRFFWVGATSPQTVGGRRAHPPKAEKILVQKINKKENVKAIRSAIAATVNPALVQKRGHHTPADYPFALDASFENLSKTKDVERTLVSLGFTDELERSAKKKVRAGIGKMRGRRYRRRKGILIVIGDHCPLEKAAQNLPGIDIIAVNSLNAHVLAPGAMPGRATVWTTKALDALEKDNLYHA